VHVVVVDYGLGNLQSVCRALERCGATATVSSDASEIEQASRVVLPGVGAFSEGMRGLRERGLVEAVRNFAKSGRPLLGICLGMQLLANVSEEFGEHEGLKIIPGRVQAIPSRGTEGQPLRVPNVGWRALLEPDDVDWSGTPLRAVNGRSEVYLVHSFHVVPERKSDRLAHYMHGGHEITAAIRADSVIGFQFHPEKSGELGLSILREFLASSA
jgi:glutamine amidotransferase